MVPGFNVDWRVCKEPEEKLAEIVVIDDWGMRYYYAPNTGKVYLYSVGQDEWEVAYFKIREEDK